MAASVPYDEPTPKETFYGLSYSQEAVVVANRSSAKSYGNFFTPQPCGFLQQDTYL